MKVVLAQSAGFCRGVRRAVERAREEVRARGGPLYTDGPLIHNRQLMQQLRSEGIRETSDPAALDPGAALMIRAHGIPPCRRACLQDLRADLIDATCPDVARIQGLIRRHARAGAHILIFGDPGHAEVVGLLGYAEGRGRVITAPDAVAELPGWERVCLVAQSTQFSDTFARVAEAVRARFPQAVILDTICASTRARQDELAAIARRVDALVVVGGAHSANTVRLTTLARRMRQTFAVETADALRAEDFAGFTAVGLTAGASTPPFVIEAVYKRLAEM
jgi:(E)-4-hydroxy-3-methyl-but-2-enyl pyrophosphate reductase